MEVPVRLTLLIVACLAAGGASAHHSISPFDSDIEQTVTGEVVEFQWTNPHTWTWIKVENDDGTTTIWGLEGMSPNYLGRRGWTKRSLEPGDKVTATIFPLKSGEPGGIFLRATLEDGNEIVMWNRRAGE